MTIEALMERAYPTLTATAKRVVAYGNALQHIRGNVEEIEPTIASVPRATLTMGENGWELFHRGRLSGKVTLEVNRPGRFAAITLDDPVDALDDFFTQGPEVWSKARDEDVLDLMVAFANTVHPFNAEQARTLSKAVLLALAYRAGFEPDPTALLQEEVR